MRYECFFDGKLVNIIECDEKFILEYSSKNGYTFNEVPYRNVDKKTDQNDSEIQDIVKRQQFLEDCIAEMAGEVYS